MSARKMFAVLLLLMFCNRGFAEPLSPYQQAYYRNAIVGAVGAASGWMFYFARGAAWGRAPLAMFLFTNSWFAAERFRTTHRD